MGVTVTSASSTGSSFQLTATARMADGSSRDVTSVAAWQSSDPNLATITSAGFVTVVGTGDVELRATYAGVTGSMHVTVRGPQTYSFTGVVAEIAPNVHGIAGARVQIVVGPHTISDVNGVFSIYGLPAGRAILEVTKDGYVTYSNQIVIDRDLQMQINLYPTPPASVEGEPATARCNDKSWSWARSRVEACTSNGGVAYFVCPGPLCSS